jgi:hypothetical protein
VGWDFGYCGHYGPIVPAPDGDCGEIGAMKIGRRTVGENLPQRHFVHHKSYMTRAWFEPEQKYFKYSPLIHFVTSLAFASVMVREP